MPNENPTLSIPRDVIEPIIKAHVNQSLLSAFGNGSELIQKAIQTVLYTKVDSEGKASNYTRSDSPTKIDWMVSDVITKTVREVLEEAVVEHKAKIKKAMVESLSKRNSPLIKQLAEGLVGAIAHPDTFKWRLKVELDNK